jgi:hypothetical protein
MQAAAKPISVDAPDTLTLILHAKHCLRPDPPAHIGKACLHNRHRLASLTAGMLGRKGRSLVADLYRFIDVSGSTNANPAEIGLATCIKLD